MSCQRTPRLSRRLRFCSRAVVAPSRVRRTFVKAAMTGSDHMDFDYTTLDCVVGTGATCSARKFEGEDDRFRAFPIRWWWLPVATVSKGVSSCDDEGDDGADSIHYRVDNVHLQCFDVASRMDSLRLFRTRSAFRGDSFIHSNESGSHTPSAPMNTTTLLCRSALAPDRT